MCISVLILIYTSSHLSHTFSYTSTKDRQRFENNPDLLTVSLLRHFDNKAIAEKSNATQTVRARGLSRFMALGSAASSRHEVVDTLAALNIMRDGDLSISLQKHKLRGSKLSQPLINEMYLTLYLRQRRTL